MAALASACKQTPAIAELAQRSTGTFTVLHAMDNVADGASPRGSLLELNGRLYGLNGEAGPNEGGTETNYCNSNANWNGPLHLYECPGTLFSLAMDGSDFRVEHAFTQIDPVHLRNVDGYHPYGSLALGLDGKLYGVTQGGGTPPVRGGGSGVLFSFDPATSTFTTVHNFCTALSCRDGVSPMGLPALLADGRIAGTTIKGGANSNAGTLWLFDPGSGTFSYFLFDVSAIGGSEQGGLALRAGMLEGMTWSGGPSGYGSYFAFDPVANAFADVADFPAFTSNFYGQGNAPIQAPIALSDGSAMVGREYAGAHGTGQILRVNGSGMTVERDFDDINELTHPRFSNSSGAMPSGQLAVGCDGMVYGVTGYGGDNGAGTIFRMNPDGSGFELVYSFPLSNPDYPYGGLTTGSDCALYGTTFVHPIVFKFVPPGSSGADASVDAP